MKVKRAADHHRVMVAIDKQAIVARRGWYCECGCGKPGHDLHHAIIPRQKRFPMLNAEENLVLVNHMEHIDGKFDTLEWRKKFWLKQCRRYGVKHMAQWLASLPDKLRYRIDFIDAK